MNIRFLLIFLGFMLCAFGGAYAAGMWVFINSINNESSNFIRIKITDPTSQNKIDGRVYTRGEPYVVNGKSSVSTHITIPWQLYGGKVYISVFERIGKKAELLVANAYMQDINGRVYLKKADGLAPENNSVQESSFGKNKDVSVRVTNDGVIVMEQV